MKNTIFLNLFAALQAEIIIDFNKFIEDLNKETSTESILGKWYYKQLLTPTTKSKKWELQELKDYLIKRETKKNDKKLSEYSEKLDRVAEADELREVTISIEWNRNRTWGACPKAQADVNYNRFFSSSITGCGYDKESTAFSAAINQSREFLKAMYLVKENNITKSCHELFGYGSGYGILPRLEGGVGTSCYPTIFEKIGFKLAKVASGKSYDCYTATKIS